MTPAPLNYSTQPRRRRLIHPALTVIVLCVLSLGLWVFLRGGLLTSADIRLDTGDLRYRYLGVPLFYSRMREPQRSQLLALAANSKVLLPEWYTCANFPLKSSNLEDLMCRSRYFYASAWAKEDPQLARMMLENFARGITTPSAAQGSGLLSNVYVQRWANGVWAVKQGWRQDADVVAYMASKYYTPPSTQPAASGSP